MEELKQKFRFPLNIQYFAEGEGDGDGGDGGAGNQTPPPEETVPKALFDKKLSELASLSKQIKAMQTDEQRVKAEKEETEKTIKELSDFKTKSTIENGLLKASISDKEAGEIAQSIIEGNFENMTKAFGKALSTALAEKDKEIAELKLKIDEPSGASNGDKPVTEEDFKKMELDERIEFKIKNPELYKKFTGK